MVGSCGGAVGILSFPKVQFEEGTGDAGGERGEISEKCNRETKVLF